MIHEAREGGRSIAKTEWDLIELVQLSTAGTKGGLCFITLCDRHLPIAAFEVEGRKPLSPMESIEEVVYPGQRVSVFDGSCVELSKIDAKTQATVLFPRHYHRRSPRTVGGADDVAGQHLLDLRHLLPSNSRVLSPIRLVERGPCVSIVCSSSGVLLRSSSPWLKTSLNSRNRSFSCCCWSGEKRFGKGGRRGGPGWEAVGGASVRVTTSRTPIFCPECSWRGSGRWL